MRLRERTLTLDIVSDHVLVRLGDELALIDTGSPLTFRAPPIVSEQLGRPVRWLVGNDVLGDNRVLLDWKGRRVVINGPRIRGEEIPLIPTSGVFQIELDGPDGPATAFLDSGAPTSYAPASAVRGLVPVERHKDFYPMVGEFDVDVYRLSVRVGSRTIEGLFGVLPELLAGLLAMVGESGWILGADFFRDRAIQLDFGARRLIDAPADAVRTTTTRPDGRSTRRHTTAPVGPDTPDMARPRSAIRETADLIDGWRGWRLVAMHDGSPRLVSLSARHVWDAPVFVSDELPSLVGGNSRAGVHAYRTPGGMAALMSGSAAIVYGQVTLFGQVCVHETGYRAERARIDRLYLRACGVHQRVSAPLGPAPITFFDLVALQADETAGAFCGCRELTHDAWLTYDELETLASALSTRYECEVTVDMQRARTAGYFCSAERLLNSPPRRN